MWLEPVGEIGCRLVVISGVYSDEVIKNPEYKKFYFKEDLELMEKITEAKGKKGMKEV